MIKKVIEIDVDVLNANGGLESLQNSFKETETKGESLRTELRRLKQQLAELPEGSEEFNRIAKRAGEVSDSIGDISARVKNLGSDTKNIDAVVEGAQAMSGAFSIATSASALLGTENKDLQETMLKVESAIGLTVGIQSVANALQKETALSIGLSNVATKVQIGLQTAYATVVGVSTGAMKLFRLALVATGVGALVVGIGLLIANFDKVKAVVLKFIPGLAQVGEMVKNIVNAVTDFIGVTSEADRAIEKQKDYAEKALKQTEKYLLLNEHKLSEAQKKELQLRKEHFQRVIDGEITQAQSVKIYREKVAQEDKKAQDEINAKRLEQQKKAQEEQNKLNEEAKKKREQERKDERDKLNENAKELQDVRDRIENERIKKEAELKAKAKEIQDRIAEETKPELSEREALEAKYQMEYDLLVSAKESTLALTAKYSADVLAIDEKEKQIKIQNAEQEKLREKAVADAKIEIAQNTLSLVAEIAGKGSKIGKAVAIAQATISGIQGVQNAFTSASANTAVTALFPAYPFIQAGLAGAFSLLQIKKIASTNSSSGGGGGSAPSSSSGGGAQAPNFNVVGNSGVNQIAQTLNQEQPPIQAVVVANNVTTAQSANRNIVQNATLG